MLRQLFLVICVIALTSSQPAHNDILDKIYTLSFGVCFNLIATVNDVAANDVLPSNNYAIGSQDDHPSTAVPPVSHEGTFKPQPAGSVFARLIDDIFQIPITVLQSVAKLLTNPFKHEDGAACKSC